MKTSKLKNVHLGSSAHIIDGWINYDIDTSNGATKADLRKGIPLADNSVQMIFSEHVIEHFSKDDGYKLIEECYRVLKPGGTMRIGWPGFNKLISSYLLRSRKHRRHVTPHLQLRYGHWDEIFADRLFSWEHRYAYTPRHMKDVLQEVGFNKPKQYKYMKSGYGYKWDTHNDPVTVYLEVQKP
jgi:predicted SAM-dependent methyltransferase